MILHRFMSEIEYGKLMRGETLHNHTVHRLAGRDSDAVGFCFFAEDPEAAIHWLRGTCCTDVLVSFDVPDGYLREVSAFYRDAQYPPQDRHHRILRTDYCTTIYSRNDLRILASTTLYRLEGIERLFAIAVCSSYHYK